MSNPLENDAVLQIVDIQGRIVRCQNLSKSDNSGRLIHLNLTDNNGNKPLWI